MKKFMLSAVLSSRFKLTAGAGASQIILIIFSPILTRIYDPNIFGYYGVVSTLIGITTVVGVLRYELKIAAYDEKNKSQIVSASWIIATIASFAMYAPLFGYHFATPGNTEILRPSILIAAIVMNIIASTGMMWLYFRLGENDVSIVNKSRLFGSSGQVIFQTVFGLIDSSLIGLLSGQLFGFAVSLWILLNIRQELTTDVFKNKISNLNFRNNVRFATNLIKHADYRACMSGLINGIGLGLPIFMLLNLYGPDVAGIFALCQRIAGVPVSVIAQAGANKFYMEISSLTGIDARNKSIFELVMHDLKRNLVLGLAIGLVIAIGGYLFMEMIFGSKWSQANNVMLILSPMMASRVAVLPISQALVLTGHSTSQLVFDVVRVVLVICSIFIPFTLGLAVEVMFTAFSLTNTFVYIALAFLIIVKVKKIANNV